MLPSKESLALKPLVMVSRSCFNCHCSLEPVVRRPVAVGIFTILPRLEGPWICLSCRHIKGVLAKARKLMADKLGIEFPLPQTFVEDESNER